MFNNNKLAPDFNLPDPEGNMHQLSNYTGNRLLIFLRYLG